MGERASGKAFGAKTLRLMLRFSALLNKVWGLEGCRSFLSVAYKSLSWFGFGLATVLSACVLVLNEIT